MGLGGIWGIGCFGGEEFEMGTTDLSLYLY
jgi:hypothetical protein